MSNLIGGRVIACGDVNNYCELAVFHDPLSDSVAKVVLFSVVSVCGSVCLCVCLFVCLSTL